MLFNINDVYIGKSFDLYGEFSELEIDLLKTFIKPDQYIFDVGANIGSHSISFAQLVGSKGAVFAFEPQRIIFQTLCANLSLNSITNVFTFHLALSETSGNTRVPFPDYLKQSNFGGLDLEKYNHGEFVQVMTVDHFSVPKCDLIKIDVEGMEAKVLKGAEKTIQKFRPILYVENDRSEKSVELIKLIDSYSYNIYWHRPPLFNPQNFFQNSDNAFGKTVSINLLCLPKEKDISISSIENQLQKVVLAN